MRTPHIISAKGQGKDGARQGDRMAWCTSDVVNATERWESGEPAPWGAVEVESLAHTGLQPCLAYHGKRRIMSEVGDPRNDIAVPHTSASTRGSDSVAQADGFFPDGDHGFDPG